VPQVLEWITKLGAGEGYLVESAAILICFVYAVISGFMGLSPLVGAFIAGMALADSKYLDQIMRFTEQIEVIFVPLFFVVMGASVDPNSLLHANFFLILILSLVVVA
jgi:Kef-type K+ transport system membrane component KefB